MDIEIATTQGDEKARPEKSVTAISMNDPIRISLERNDKPKPSEGWWCGCKADLIKWLLGTFVLGGLGTLINFTVQCTQLEINRVEADSKLIGSVSVKYSEGIEEQIAYLNYIEPFITSASIRSSVRTTIEALKIEADKRNAEDLRKTAMQREKEYPTVANTDQQRKAQVIPPKSQPIEHYDSKPGLDTVLIPKIEKLKDAIVPLTDNNYVLQGKPETKWCKAGYYVEFNGTVRVGVNSVRSNQVFVNIRTLDDPNVPVIGDNENIGISEGEVKQVDDGALRYKISLDYVGRAGNNPFTKAAYITVSTYKK